MNRTMIIEYWKFMPITANHFNSLLWLVKAASKDETRVNIYQTIHVEQGICYCTDGHRMHVYSQDEDSLPADFHIPDGNYLIKSITKKNIVLVEKDPDDLYPDVNRLLDYVPDRTLNGKIYCDFSLFTFDIFSKLNTLVNIDYLRDAYMPDESVSFERPAGMEGLAALLFGNETKLAMIMPLRQ
jgi:hypothetical protein